MQKKQWLQYNYFIEQGGYNASPAFLYTILILKNIYILMLSQKKSTCFSNCVAREFVDNASNRISVT